MIKTGIKLQVTPEQSAKIQQICFDNNIYWADGQNFIIDTAYILIPEKEMYKTSSFTNFIGKELTEVDPELFIATNGSCEIANYLEDLDADLMESTHTKSHAIPTTDQFAKYGFETPDFQCKLYDKLEDFILGAYFNPNKQKWTMCRWGFDGRNKQGSHNYALTPILVHKPWYETCKFPILVKDRDNCIFNLTAYSDAYIYNCTPLTDDEIEEFKRGY